MYFCHFVIISPWKGCDPSFVQTWVPKDPSCQNRNYPSGSGEKICCYFFILLLSPLEKGHCSSFEQTSIPFTQGCFTSVKFCWNWPNDTGKEDKNVKCLQTDGRTSGDQKSSPELSAELKLDIILFLFSYGKLNELLSIFIQFADIMKTSKNGKSYKIRLICTSEKIQEI